MLRMSCGVKNQTNLLQSNTGVCGLFISNHINDLHGVRGLLQSILDIFDNNYQWRSSIAWDVFRLISVLGEDGKIRHSTF